MKTLRLKDSASKGLSVLLLGKNKAQLLEWEARTEVDPDLQRVNVFSSDSIAEGTRLIREHSVQLAVVEDGLEGKDFVFMLLEARQALGNCAIVALVTTPSILS